MTQEEFKEMEDYVSKLDNQTLKHFIANMAWLQQKNPDVWKETLGDDYDSVKSPIWIQETKNYLWQEATRRGISVSDVQAEIYNIANKNTQDTITEMKSDSDFKALISKRKTQDQAKRVLGSILIAVVIIIAGLLIYKYVFKGNLNFA